MSENTASKTVFNIGVMLISTTRKAGLGGRSKPNGGKSITVVASTLRLKPLAFVSSYYPAPTLC